MDSNLLCFVLVVMANMTITVFYKYLQKGSLVFLHTAMEETYHGANPKIHAPQHVSHHNLLS